MARTNPLGTDMALISKEEIIRIARMSRIAIHEDEIEPLMKQLNDILTYAARVSEIVGPDFNKTQQKASALSKSGVQNINVWREDIPVPCNVERIIAEAPAHEANYFLVPAILEHE